MSTRGPPRRRTHRRQSVRGVRGRHVFDVCRAASAREGAAGSPDAQAGDAEEEGLAAALQRVPIIHRVERTSDGGRALVALHRCYATATARLFALASLPSQTRWLPRQRVTLMKRFQRRAYNVTQRQTGSYAKERQACSQFAVAAACATGRRQRAVARRS
jgi:hypothetical protein